MINLKKVIAGAAIFAAGLVTGLWLEMPVLSAQNRFGPDEVESVPDSFLRGGDRTYSVLQEMRALMQEQNAHLVEISKNTASAAKSNSK